MMVHKHKWTVYSTSLCPPCILVECECGKLGFIEQGNYTCEEWSKAYYAPSNPYEWDGSQKVIKIVDAPDE